VKNNYTTYALIGAGLIATLYLINHTGSEVAGGVATGTELAGGGIGAAAVIGVILLAL
jgi:hypothetical protein